MTHIKCLLLHQLEIWHCYQVAALAVKNSEWPAINCDGQKVRLVTFQVFSFQENFTLPDGYVK